MNFFKRALASMGRRPGKTVILLLLVFVLGNVISGAISIRQAVLNTDANLRSQLPGIAALDYDHMAANAYWNRGEEPPEFERLTADHIREVGNLEYVRSFNYSMTTRSFSLDLDRYFNPITNDEFSADSFQDWNAMRPQGADFEEFQVRGISNPELFEIQTGIMELVSGRLMTEAELANGEPVAIISRGLAQQNNLDIGSTTTLTVANFDWSSGLDWASTHTEENILGRYDQEVTVVGIVDMLGELEGENIWTINDRKMEIENRFYVPNGVAENMVRHQAQMSLEHDEWMVSWMEETGMDMDEVVDSWVQHTALFYLEDPAYLAAFAEAADAILPGFNTVTDLSNTFGDIAGSMDTMLMIANIVLWVSVGATLVILSLLITLFLRDRKYEIGIYLALGEKKSKIISQVLIEVMSTAVVAVALALFTGSMISSGISQQMLENDLINRREENFMMGGWWSQGQHELAMFSPGEMTMEQMLAAYDTSLDGATIALFFGVATATVLVSTTAPILYVMRLNPKKIMM